MSILNYNREELITSMKDVVLLTEALDKLLDMSRELLPLLSEGDSMGALKVVMERIENVHGIIAQLSNAVSN